MAVPNTKTNDVILIVEDEKPVRDSLTKLLKNSGYKSITAQSAEEGIQLFAKDRPLVVLTDLKMEHKNSGIALLEEVRNIYSDAVVILYTAYGSIPNVVEAFKKGAFDYIQKVQTHFDILQPVERAFKYAKMQRENEELRNRLSLNDDGSFHGAVAVSEVMKKLFEKAKRVAQSNATVLITGETGTGKEIIARGLHYYSNRRDASFVPVAVGSIPESLLEGELFGHIKGSYTGALQDKAGLIEVADKGTLFLDEVGEVSFETQHKLLRVLQDKTVRRVGDHKEREVDVRFLSATNCDPEELVKEKKMREDLYYRINVIRLHIPTLRERPEDVPILAYHFLRYFRHQGTHEVERISSDALMLLQQYDWPGNVRELQSIIEEMVTLTSGDIISVEDLPEKIRPRNRRVFVESNTELSFKEFKAKIVEDFEKQYIEDLLKKHNGNITKVAAEAGLNRKTIYRLMEARNIQYDKNKVVND